MFGITYNAKRIGSEVGERIVGTRIMNAKKSPVIKKIEVVKS